MSRTCWFTAWSQPCSWSHDSYEVVDAQTAGPSLPTPDDAINRFPLRATELSFLWSTAVISKRGSRMKPDAYPCTLRFYLKWREITEYAFFFLWAQLLIHLSAVADPSSVPNTHLLSAHRHDGWWESHLLARGVPLTPELTLWSTHGFPSFYHHLS